MYDNETFRINLVMRRKSCNLSQEKLADLAEISVKNLSRIERGNQEPSLKTIVALLNAFNVSYASFMEEETNAANLKMNIIASYIPTLPNSELEFLQNLVQELKEGVD